jgi:predicted amidohydrolase
MKGADESRGISSSHEQWLLAAKGGRELIASARKADIARATENDVWVIRADIAGRAGKLASHGSSGIVDPRGIVVRSARDMSDDLLTVEIESELTRERGCSANRAWPNGTSSLHLTGDS